MTTLNRFLWAGIPAPWSTLVLASGASMWNFLLLPDLGGLSLALASFVAFGMVIWATRNNINRRQVFVAFWIFLVGVVPLLIQATVLAWCISIAALCAVIWYLTDLKASLIKLALAAIYLLPWDVAKSSKHMVQVDGSVARSFLQNWGVAVVGALGFGGLFLVANPVLANWAQGLSGIDIDAGRVWFFAFSAMVLWPLTQLGRAPKAGSNTQDRDVVLPIPMLALRNALIVFNLLFLMQTLTDFAILSGGAKLPEGMSMGEYVHRGAYPLLVTALLAGGFAVIVRQAPNPPGALKLLLVLWIAQTILLVAASAMRLEAYVSAYGLTHLRVWAAAWMAVVAFGLGILMVNTARELPLQRFLQQACILGAVALYGMSLVNLPATIARHNVGMLEAGERFDTRYTCRLGPMAAHVLSKVDRCYRRKGPRIHDWRQWDFRTASIANSLTPKMETAR
ncbi:DUF4173 domain-containing protein [Algirhabdus cladophorae]|uniref:DUF4153 domain-containing protein n=1 Tax=Algirhabdus cladophorae TaxID=3377108 RepID=UPI003B849162